jgi:hypothetical protein
MASCLAMETPRSVRPPARWPLLGRPAPRCKPVRPPAHAPLLSIVGTAGSTFTAPPPLHGRRGAPRQGFHHPFSHPLSANGLPASRGRDYEDRRQASLSAACCSMPAQLGAWCGPWATRGCMLDGLFQAGPARNRPVGPGLGRRRSPWATPAQHDGM